MEGGGLFTKKKVITREETKNKILNYNIATYDFIFELLKEENLTEDGKNNLNEDDKKYLTAINYAISSIINGTLLYYDLIYHIENIINTNNNQQIIEKKEKYIKRINEIVNKPYSEPRIYEANYPEKLEFPKEVVEIRNKIKGERELLSQKLAEEAAAKVQEKAAAAPAAPAEAEAEAEPAEPAEAEPAEPAEAEPAEPAEPAEAEPAATQQPSPEELNDKIRELEKQIEYINNESDNDNGGGVGRSKKDRIAELEKQLADLKKQTGGKRRKTYKKNKLKKKRVSFKKN